MEAAHNTKHGSAFIFTLDCDDAKTRKTRLLNLDWSFDGDSKRKSSKKKRARAEVDAADDGEAVKAAKQKTNAAKTTGRLSDAADRLP